MFAEGTAAGHSYSDVVNPRCAKGFAVSENARPT
jgi:hypothetical protein